LIILLNNAADTPIFSGHTGNRTTTISTITTLTVYATTILTTIFISTGTTSTKILTCIERLRLIE
jgi:hypothetical protein